MKKTRKTKKSAVEQVEEKIEEKPKEEKKLKEEEKSPTFLTYSEMTDKQMEYYLFELSNTIYWQAVLRLGGVRNADILNTLASNDPFREPTNMARNQGELIGINNLKNKVEDLVKRNKEASKSKEEKNKDEDNTPSYNRW